MRKKALISALSVNLSQKWLDTSHMFLVSLCASLRSANDRLVCLWLRCDFSTLYNAEILFHTRAYKFCICISRVVNNIESNFHLRTTCGRCEMKPYSYILLTTQKFRTKMYIPHLSATGVDQKPNYNCLKFSEPFTEHQQCLVKGSEYFETLCFAFCWTPSIQILTKFT